jgi:hypothetical protein
MDTVSVAASIVGKENIKIANQKLLEEEQNKINQTLKILSKED